MHFQRLEDLRVDHDKTQIEVAEYLNMGRNVYWRYEKGKRSPIPPPTGDEKAGAVCRRLLTGNLRGAVSAAAGLAAARGLFVPGTGLGVLSAALGGPPPERGGWSPWPARKGRRL